MTSVGIVSVMTALVYGTAACVLIVDDSGCVLAVSRKGNMDAFGIPGGKKEPHETFEEAATRELSEETGLRVFNLRKLYEGPCKNDVKGDEFYTVTFVCEFSGIPVSSISEGTRTEWVTWERLFDGPFGKYNRVLQSAFIAMKREDELQEAV